MRVLARAIDAGVASILTQDVGAQATSGARLRLIALTPGLHPTLTETYLLCR